MSLCGLSYRAVIFEEWDLKASQEAYLAVRGARAAPGEPAEEGGAAPEPLDKAMEPIQAKFDAPDIVMYTDAVNWPCSGEKTTGEVGFYIGVEINAADEAKYADLLAWTEDPEVGLALTAKQKGLLTMKSYKKGTSSMWIFEEWCARARARKQNKHRSEASERASCEPL